jgi:hypothetical protein
MSGSNSANPTSKGTMTSYVNTFTILKVDGYTYIPFKALPPLFTLTRTSTGNAWTNNGGAISDGGAYPTITYIPSQPANIYSGTYPGTWYTLQDTGGVGYTRHSGYLMSLQSYTANNFDFAWAFYLQNGTTNQIKIFNPYPGNGVGYWVQSGVQQAGRIAISTTDPTQAHIYTISVPFIYSFVTGNMTGTSLFSQLSLAAVTSAMGAFSLRAVNGTTAKAVNVRRSTDNATQDFYADRLGNLLTVPVTGQTLASWLGGAIGYVATWYDQSGKGNHATATVANQPKIDTANNWVDFKTSAFFNLPNGTVPFGNTNYTICARHNTINSTTADIISSGTEGTIDATNSLEWNITSYCQYWWGDDIIGGTLATGNKILAKYDNTIGRTLYVNGTSVATNSSKVRNSTNLNNFIGTDPRNRYLNGELYYVMIFGTALSDADRVLVEAAS